MKNNIFKRTDYESGKAKDFYMPLVTDTETNKEKNSEWIEEQLAEMGESEDESLS